MAHHVSIRRGKPPLGSKSADVKPIRRVRHISFAPSTAALHIWETTREIIMHKFILAMLTTCCATVAIAQTPKDQLEAPPANAQKWSIVSTGGQHGQSFVWRAADGTLKGRESLLLRGQVWEIDSVLASSSFGQPVKLVVRGVTPQGDAAETFSITDGMATWKSQVDGASAVADQRYYNAFGGPIALTADLAERLVAAPNMTLRLLPGGEARAEPLTTLTVGTGAKRQTITAYVLTGLSTSPVPFWMDANGRFFGINFGLAWLPAGYEDALKPTEAAQDAALAVRTAQLAKTLPKTPTGPVAFENVRIYDADAKRFLTGQTVVVSGSKITAVGPAARTKIPADAQRMPTAGMTLVPGLWDVHMHVGNDYTGFQELSLGVTSVRDPGNSDSATIDRRTRWAKGDLLFPTVYASSLIDGKGPNSAQVANIATTLDEAIGWVRKAKENGFVGIKIYGTFNPTWVKATVAEARKLGLHVHGHIPQGMRPIEAINAGYDEITHINWVIMQGMPDSVIQASNGIARFEGPGRYAKDLDLDAAPMRTMIATMAKRKIASDPTAIAFESLYVPENGDLSPSYAPFVGTLPPASERGFRQGGFKVPEGLTRADYRASWAKMVALIGKMHKAGVPINAGTDGSGIEIVHELEIYQQAGMTPAEALYTATLSPAKLVGQDKTTGSIKVGKVADLVLVEGDPSVRIGDLRQTRTVMLGGKLLDADALRAAAGYSGRPK
jgi:imidazolonepropionase-like amidohydrolase